VPVDQVGLVVDALPRGIKLVYVTPSHQYPLGVPMTLARRRALLAWAERHDVAIIEDDYDSEFRFGGRPLEPLQTLDVTGRVIYVGSFSKTLLPAAVAQRAIEAGVAIQTLAHFAVGERARAGVMLGYAAIATADIMEGLSRLRRCFR
jgi:DNA-binding transcriptional MocR family regulator